MIRFHPDENMLVEYVAGTLDHALAISVKAHLQMCSKCREQVSQLNLIGSAIVMNDDLECDANHDNEEAFSALMARIKSTPKEQFNSAPKEKKKQTSLPEVVDALLPRREKLKWKRVSPSLKQANLRTGQHQYEVCLHKISKGGKVAHHDHRGLEVTLVLKGAFSDENGSYKAGDFLLRQPGDRHRPTATQNQDCLCLSIAEAPVKLIGPLGTLINPFLRVNPS